ncbi:MAG: V-type ATPase subunit [Anaerolineaceae bacterium]|nr:V-type ATPase subunit [Anaerolineaceae bacterium]
MPGGVTGYAAINASVRVKYAALLSTQELLGIFEAADFHALLRLLKHTTYGPYLERVDEKDLTPRRAIYQIKGQMADAYASIIRSSPPQTHKLLRHLYRHFEVDNLKAVLRGIVTGASWDRVRYVLFPFGSMTVLPAEEMLETGNIPAAVELLNHTPYYETLSHAMERFTAEQNLFPLEVALDLSYWRELWNDVFLLPNQDRPQALRIIGSLVDMNNLMWAIRYRIYHHLSEEELINYTLSIGYQVRDQDIRDIAAGADIQQVVARIFPALPNVDTLLREPRKGLIELEVQLHRHVAEQCRAVFAGYPFQIGIPIAFLALKEMEAQDLTVLIEAKDAQVAMDDFRPYLVLAERAG